MGINNDVYYNDWGFECDVNGNILRTRYNLDLEAQLREEEEEEKYGRQVQRGNQSRRPNTQTSIRRKDDYYDDEEDYDDNIQRVYSKGSNSNVSSRRNANNSNVNRKASSAVFDLDDEEPIRPSSKSVKSRYDEDINKKVNKVEKRQVVNKEIPHYEFTKPVDGNYHEILLPKGFKQKRIHLPPTLLDDDKYIVYYKREIYEEGTNMNGDGLSFGEDMFNKTSFAPLSLEVGALVNVNSNDDDACIIDRATDVVDQLLVLINSTAKERVASEIYYADSFVVSRYFNNTGKNLFLDLVNDESFRFSNLKDIMARLEAIYKRYSENKNTLNGISKIDKELTESFNAYIAAYSATTKYSVFSLMKFASEFYKAVTTSPEILDSDLRKNIINGMAAFFTTFVTGISSYIKDIKTEDEVDMICPTRELVVISENVDLSRELTEIENKNDKNVFYAIDRIYTPYIHDMLTRLDKEKTLQSFNRVVFYNYKNVYTIIKCGEGKFTLSNFESRN